MAKPAYHASLSGVNQADITPRTHGLSPYPPVFVWQIKCTISPQCGFEAGDQDHWEDWCKRLADPIRIPATWKVPLSGWKAYDQNGNAVELKKTMSPGQKAISLYLPLLLWPRSKMRSIESTSPGPANGWVSRRPLRRISGQNADAFGT